MHHEPPLFNYFRLFLRLFPFVSVCLCPAYSACGELKEQLTGVFLHRVGPRDRTQVIKWQQVPLSAEPPCQLLHPHFESQV